MHFIFTFAHGGARGGARSRLEKNMWGAFPPCGVFSLCGKSLGLFPFEQISGGTHIFDARVVPNNNVALTGLEINCKT